MKRILLGLLFALLPFTAYADETGILSPELLYGLQQQPSPFSALTDNLKLGCTVKVADAAARGNCFKRAEEIANMEFVVRIDASKSMRTKAKLTTDDERASFADAVQKRAKELLDTKESFFKNYPGVAAFANRQSSSAL